MRPRAHPLSRAIYDVREDGLLDVTDHGVSGVFDAEGRWISGDLRHCDPQLCGWLARPQLPDGVPGNPKEFIDDDWTDAYELGPLTRVFNQDVYNLPRVQEGLASGAIDEVVFARYQETKIRAMHAELDRWLAKP